MLSIIIIIIIIAENDETISRCFCSYFFVIYITISSCNLKYEVNIRDEYTRVG